MTSEYRTGAIAGAVFAAIVAAAVVVVVADVDGIVAAAAADAADDNIEPPLETSGRVDPSYEATSHCNNRQHSARYQMLVDVALNRAHDETTHSSSRQ